LGGGWGFGGVGLLGFRGFFWGGGGGGGFFGGVVGLWGVGVFFFVGIGCGGFVWGGWLWGGVGGGGVWFGLFFVWCRVWLLGVGFFRGGFVGEFIGGVGVDCWGVVGVGGGQMFEEKTLQTTQREKEYKAGNQGGIVATGGGEMGRNIHIKLNAAITVNNGGKPRSYCTQERKDLKTDQKNGQNKRVKATQGDHSRDKREK